MSDEKPRPTFNPTWVMVAIAIGSGGVSGITSAAINSRDVAELRQWKAGQEQWAAQVERRFAIVEKDSAVDRTAVQKDLAALQVGISEIRSALLVNGVQRPSRNNPQ